MRELVLTRAAEADLDEIWLYIFEQNPDAADGVINKITSKFNILRDYPDIGHIRQDVGQKYISLPVGSYVIFYRSKAEKIEISRVLHGARDMSAIFPDSD